jgi:hypothetical protein
VLKNVTQKSADLKGGRIVLTKHERHRMRVAMVESQASANAKWTPQQQMQVDTAIRKMARMLPRFTADQVWYELGASFPVTKGMTARLLVAQRNGVIKNTGEVTFAERGGEHDHAQRLTIWQSL